AQNTGNYVVNGGAVAVSSAVLRAVDGGQSAVLTVSGLSHVAGAPFTVVAGNIKDVASAGNVGGGSASSIVLGLTAADVGTAGVDPIVAGSTFVCSSNQMEVLGGGSDLGGVS